VIEELLRELAATGDQEAHAPRAASAFPRGVKELIARRLKRCRDGTREALLAAAVLGREFRFDALGRRSRTTRGRRDGGPWTRAIEGPPDRGGSPAGSTGSRSATR